MERLTSITERIAAPDAAVGEAAQARLDNLTKPQGSLGLLEDMARWLCVARGNAAPLAQPKAAVTVFAADHGIAAAGVSPFPPEVTAQMVYNFLAEGAGINALCSQAGCDVKVVDVGVNHDFGEAPGLIKAKVAKGSANMLEAPAMTLDQALSAMAVGAEVAADLVGQGYDLLIAGEMGIGNTSPCAAITSVLCGLPVEEVTGRGAGLDDGGLGRKVEAIKQAIALHQPPPDQPLEVLCKLGGLEIAAICGYFLEAAAQGVPVILDGFIATTGALVAGRICPAARAYFMAGHSSVEIGHRAQLADMGLTPLLSLNLRLGEGTGAVVALGVLRQAVAMYSNMATFADAGVSNEKV